MHARFLLALVAALPAVSQQFFTWRNVNIQGMGYVTGLIAHPASPHDIYIRTDVGGAYRFDRAAARWLPLMDRYGTDDSAVFGVESIAGDPSDPNVVYAAAGARVLSSGGGGFYNEKTYAEVLVSHSRGAFFAATGLAARHIYVGANDPARGTTGERLAVDPLKPARLYFGSRKDGLWIKDGEWIKAGGSLPETNDAAKDPEAFGVTFVLPDASSGAAANGATRRIYAGVYASGVWSSDDGGVRWTNLGGTHAARAALGADGTLFVTFGGDEGGRDGIGAVSGGVKRYRGGVWADVTPPAGLHDTYSGISVSPVDPLTVAVAATHDFKIYVSHDQGATWQAVPAGQSVENEPPYYPKPQPGNYNTHAGSWGNAALVIDPLNTRRLWQTNGYGVIKTDDMTAATPAWSWVMNNLEELCAQSIKAPPVLSVPGMNEPGADLLSAVADMVGLRHGSRDAVPTATFIRFPWVAQATSIAYAAQRPENAAFVGWDQTDSASRLLSGTTSDNGKTWTPFPAATPPGTAGVIAMSATDPRNMVWAPVGKAPVYTTDAGASWLACGFPAGVRAASWQLSNAWWASQVIAADAVEGGRFYYFLWNETLPQTSADLYVSADRGATWSRSASVPFTDPAIAYTVKTNVVVNPAAGGDIWIAVPRNGNQPKLFPLLRSVDGGRTFGRVSGVDGANFVAFGKGKSAGVPFVYIHGRAGGAAADAIYKSEDLGATWIRISDPSQQQFGNISALEGDMRTRDLVYVATGGRGILYGFGAGAGIAQPSFPAEGIVNAASFQYGGSVAPGEMLTIFGQMLGPGELIQVAADEAGDLSSTAGNTQVFFDGMPAPMIYSWASQITAVAPYWLAGRADTAVQVGYEGQLSAPVTVPVKAIAPGVFFVPYTTRAVAVNILADHTRVLNDDAHRAPKGAYLEFYLTGEGVTNPPAGDGRPPGPEYPAPAGKVTVRIGGAESTGAECPFNWAGLIYAGVTQIDACVPAAAQSGAAVPLEVAIGGQTVQSGITVGVE
jgi:xyloglucan-specific exo-beta-1,4-glucanase